MLIFNVLISRKWYWVPHFQFPVQTLSRNIEGKGYFRNGLPYFEVHLSVCPRPAPAALRFTRVTGHIYVLEWKAAIFFKETTGNT
jgi:hypothetical protein